jgi:aryl-alcohol dehydrogenase-like predicted oxidoreductase
VFDTARAYAPFGDPGYAERLLADALAGEPDLLVMTKGGHWRDGAQSWAVDNSPARLRADVETSLRELRTERLDLFFVHRVDDTTVPLEESVGALAELRDAGLIARVGLSNVAPDQLARAAALTPIGAVQNAAATDETLAICERLGIANILYSPLAGTSLRTPRARLAALLAASPVRSVVTGATRPESIADSAAAVPQEDP